jgi:16S rRNA (guanine966-N2)-methyltransferase
MRLEKRVMLDGNMSDLRILGGSAKGRILRIPSTARPTAARIRKSLFDILEHGFSEDAKVLDLFAGAGAVGLEAASRGFEVVMVERDAKAALTLERNRRELGVTAKIIRGDALKYLETAGQFDVVFIDPPYTQDLQKLTEQALKLVKLEPEGVLISQHPVQLKLEPVEGFELERRVYGSNVLSMYWKGSEL